MIKSNKENNLVLVTDHNFNEEDYLQSNPDVAEAVREGIIPSGKVHFDIHGRHEARKMQITSNTTNPLYQRIIKVFSKRIKRTTSQPRPVETGLRDLQISLNQVLDILRLETNVPLPPPKHLQVRVVGGYSPDFIKSGYTSIYPTLNRVLKPAGKELKDFQIILDFGCGCGRAIRALATLEPQCRLYGTDVDEEAIAWLKQNYSKFAEYSVAPHFPPTIYADQMFDLVFGISVFTHLPEDMQFQWLKELVRITKPYGYVILTTHGEKHYKKFDPKILNIMNTKGFYYSDFGFNYGKSISLPDWYQGAWHSHAYIRREWQAYFDVIDIQTLAIDNHQDTILLQKRP